MYTYSYPRPAVTVDAIVFTKENHSYSILLIQRGRKPFQGKWALPGGFMNIDELLEEACIRELNEETGLDIKQMKQFRTFDAIDRDPRGRTISVVYFTELPEKMEVKGGDDAVRAKWFSLMDLPPLAFDHRDILKNFFSE